MLDGRDPSVLNLAHWGPSQDLAFNAAGGASVSAGPFNVQVLRLAIGTTQNVRIAFGISGVVATATGTLFVGPGVEYIPWILGQFLAVISNDANSGSLNITQCQ